MPEIITEAKTVVVQEKTRAKTVVINNPLGGTKSIDFLQEVVTLTDSVPTDSRGVLPLTILVDDVISDKVTVNDPIVGGPVEISVAGIAMAIEEFYVKWFNAKKPALEYAKPVPLNPIAPELEPE